MPSADEIGRFRDANAELTRLVEADLERFWSFLDLSDPDRSLNALMNYVPLLTQRYGEIAATLAADWFDMLRGGAVEEGVLVAVRGATTYKAAAASPIAATVSRRAVESVGGYLRTDDPVRALDKLKVTTGRHVLQAGRDTITRNAGRDRSARGWQRFVRPGGCKFCRMLSSRGGVYTQASSHFAAHDHCNCVSAPTWDRSAPKVDVAAQFVASAHTSHMSDRQREQFRARVRQYMARMPDDTGAVHIDAGEGVA